MSRRGRAASPGRCTRRRDVAPAEQEAGDVGERVPADRERADLDQHRVDRGKRQRQRQQSAPPPALFALAVMARDIDTGRHRPQGEQRRLRGRRGGRGTATLLRADCAFRNRCALASVAVVRHVMEGDMPAKSKAQQKAAGAALAAKRGDQKVSNLKGPAKSMYKKIDEREGARQDGLDQAQGQTGARREEEVMPTRSSQGGAGGASRLGGPRPVDPAVEVMMCREYPGPGVCK